MLEHRLKAPVPVDWLDETSHFDFFDSSLEAGTVLDCGPVLMAGVDLSDPASAAIRIGGRHGVVALNRLREALPTWTVNPCSQA
jgi:hypothetical protein